MSTVTSPIESPATSSPTAPQTTVVGMLAEFETPGALVAACRKVRDAGYEKFDAHSPMPIHGIDDAMGIKMTRLPLIVLICGIIGALKGTALVWWTNAANPVEWLSVPTFLQPYQYLIGGKPEFSLAANIPVIFELTILLSAFGAVFGMLAMNNLPLFNRPIFNSRRFLKVTTDGYFISVEAADPRYSEAATRELLQSAGAMAIESIEDRECFGRRPGWTTKVAVVAACVALIPLALIYRAWNAKSSQPRIHIIQDMDNQEKYGAQRAQELFVDGRTARLPVLGAVARGQTWLDDHYYRGLTNGSFAAQLPLERPEISPTMTFMKRGQRQFDIYCAACHGVDGSGQGMVHQRAAQLLEAGKLGTAWVPPVNLHEQQYREQADGQIFATISNGARTMPAYGDRLSESDRWAVVAYVRALQLSRAAPLENLDAEFRAQLEQDTGVDLSAFAQEAPGADRESGEVALGHSTNRNEP